MTAATDRGLAPSIKGQTRGHLPVTRGFSVAVATQTNPRLPHRPYPPTTSSPRGSHPEVCRWWGWGRRPRPVSQAGLGRLRGTALGVIRPLREELAGRQGDAQGFREPGDDEAVSGRRGTGPSRNPAPAAESATGRTKQRMRRQPYKRGPETEERRRAERHGACDGWLNPAAPFPGSTEADLFSRLAALRQPRFIRPRRAPGAGGAVARVRSGAASPWTMPADAEPLAGGVQR